MCLLRKSDGFIENENSFRRSFKAVVLKLFQEEAPLRRVNSFVAPPKENS